MMGGEIWCEPNTIQGTTFHFTVIVDRGSQKNSIQHDTIVAQYTSSLDILLVEDNIINSEIARNVLEKDGHSVVTAEDGLKSLEAIASRGFDLILMDVQMPVMDGLTASNIIRASENGDDLSQFSLSSTLMEKLVQNCTGKHIPIVAMTANAMAGDKQKCLDAGMDNYLTKPFKPDQIREVIADIVTTTSK